MVLMSTRVIDLLKLQALVSGLFALLGEAQWGSPDEARSAAKWICELKVKARNLGIAVDD
jgi:hypothetical protein